MNILSIDCDWVRSPEQAIELVRLCKHFQHNENVYFIKEHQTCANYIKPGDTLYNIDHHHDIVYNDEQVVNIKENEIYNLIKEKILLVKIIIG